MVAYVLIPKLAFEHRDALLERARKSISYGCFQTRGDEVIVAFGYDQSAIMFYSYCVAKGIRLPPPELEVLIGLSVPPDSTAWPGGFVKLRRV
jgi:hypothetical protein